MKKAPKKEAPKGRDRPVECPECDQVWAWEEATKPDLDLDKDDYDEIVRVCPECKEIN